ncbi:uncharacterized protein BDR25DRAFT_35525 [Lindgomyces ingoldianus]|uniref:Uncharacterized protein n=1 Tax=Lindgomyces ingoldianus TaxID=673940 RepID=A0ACB6QWT6_9PLEO|nr:uncharacterized protein BDR25DRAFT_35525 [Lindgomyces ingoldianus]KAF2470540.1 hypothetical protein BDR25DRAFT_35525 [Lindgomyces ingoldianus]
MVKFVCYLLRIVANEQARMMRQNDSSSSEGSDAQTDEGEDGSASGDDSDITTRHYQHHPIHRRRTKVDTMKDARELFC